MIEPNQDAKAILAAIKYVTVATVSIDAQPWNTPLATFRFNNDHTLYWASWQNNQHSQNIRANGKAFMVIYDSTPANGEPTSGVYMTGTAFEITDEQEAMQAALVFGDDPYNSSDGKQYLGGYPRRIYKFVPNNAWKNDDSEIDGNFIDVRTEADV